tara:strand:+ start:9822 stop:10232 length:411 start_codon:yes stop_codon:yes gene_type:complete
MSNKLNRQRVKRDIEAELEELTVEFYERNQQANKATRKATEARKKLYSLMKEQQLDSQVFDTRCSTGRVILEASFQTPTRTVVDVHQLRKLVNDKDFMECVSATKSSVVGVAGTEVATRCSEVKNLTENVVVKPKK